MKYIDVATRKVHLGKGGKSAPVIYVVDAADHPFDLEAQARDRFCTIVQVAARDWGASLTPWPAPGIYREEPDFQGDAQTTLSELVGKAIPAIEQAEGLCPGKRAIGGYSLGGLFSLYAFTHAEEFCACACLSGSVWYEGWVDHLRELPFDGAGRFAFLSIGSKEKHAAPRILHHVQDNMEECTTILQGHGCTTEFVVGPGSHMSHIDERFDAGLSALDAFLGATISKL